MKFSKNWEKLGWVIFTTIRQNTGRYKLGHSYAMNTPMYKFRAKVIGLYPIKKAEITDELANTDAETTRATLITMLEDWYGKDFDDYVLITLWSVYYKGGKGKGK